MKSMYIIYTGLYIQTESWIHEPTGSENSASICYFIIIQLNQA